MELYGFLLIISTNRKFNLIFKNSNIEKSILTAYLNSIFPLFLFVTFFISFNDDVFLPLCISTTWLFLLFFIYFFSSLAILSKGGNFANTMITFDMSNGFNLLFFPLYLFVIFLLCFNSNDLFFPLHISATWLFLFHLSLFSSSLTTMSKGGRLSQHVDHLQHVVQHRDHLFPLYLFIVFFFCFIVMASFFLFIFPSLGSSSCLLFFVLH